MFEANFLGRGWAFPPSFTPNGADMVAGVTDIEQSLHIILTTRVRERVMSPAFGCDMLENIFETINITLQTRISEQVKTAIIFFEPRIDLLDVMVSQPAEDLGTLLIDIAFRIRATNTRHNYVYPFYINEGKFSGLRKDIFLQSLCNMLQKRYTK